MDSSHGSYVGYMVLSPQNGNVYSKGSKGKRMVLILMHWPIIVQMIVLMTFKHFIHMFMIMRSLYHLCILLCPSY